jgi:hypothetical protein
MSLENPFRETPRIQSDPGLLGFDHAESTLNAAPTEKDVYRAAPKRRAIILLILAPGFVLTPLPQQKSKFLPEPLVAQGA